MRVAVWLGFVLISSPLCAQPAEKPQLLILGAPHFANPGRDVANSEIEDVRTASRQAELERLVERLAEFRPTRVAVEVDESRQALMDERYAAYLEGTYEISTNETYQIGFRLAALLGLDRVYAVDWSEPPPGGWDPYNYAERASEVGLQERYNEFVANIQHRIAEESAAFPCTTISQWLRKFNDPVRELIDHQSYYEVARIGDAGAAWVGHWHTRNLHISQNIEDLAIGSGERVLVVYGAGHNYLLKRQAEESDAFEVVNALEYIPHDHGSRC